MLYSTALAVFGSAAAVMAAPAGAPGDGQEVIKLSEFTVRKFAAARASPIKALYFKLNGGPATDVICEATTPKLPSERLPCAAGSNLGFNILPGRQQEFAVHLWHDAAGNVTLSSETDVPSDCKPADDSPTDIVCITNAPSVFVMQPVGAAHAARSSPTSMVGEPASTHLVRDNQPTSMVGEPASTHLARDDKPTTMVGEPTSTHLARDHQPTTMVDVPEQTPASKVARSTSSPVAVGEPTFVDPSTKSARATTSSLGAPNSLPSRAPMNGTA